MASTDLPVPAVALAIVAHPDDAEFHCGATLAKWAAHGCVINHLVLTDGSKGTWDADRPTPTDSSSSDGRSRWRRRACSVRGGRS